MTAALLHDRCMELCQSQQNFSAFALPRRRAASRRVADAGSSYHFFSTLFSPQILLQSATRRVVSPSALVIIIIITGVMGRIALTCVAVIYAVVVAMAVTAWGVHPRPMLRYDIPRSLGTSTRFDSPATETASEDELPSASRSQDQGSFQELTGSQDRPGLVPGTHWSSGPRLVPGTHWLPGPSRARSRYSLALRTVPGSIQELTGSQDRPGLVPGSHWSSGPRLVPGAHWLSGPSRALSRNSLALEKTALGTFRANFSGVRKVDRSPKNDLRQR